jgi:hypothetical protein
MVLGEAFDQDAAIAETVSKISAWGLTYSHQAHIERRVSLVLLLGPVRFDKIKRASKRGI